MHLPRLRLRTLLIAVAIAGVVLGGWTMKRRERCLLAAERLEEAAEFYEQNLGELGAAGRCRRTAAYFRHVARYPWLPMPSEPE